VELIVAIPSKIFPPTIDRLTGRDFLLSGEIVILK